MTVLRQPCVLLRCPAHTFVLPGSSPVDLLCATHRTLFYQSAHGKKYVQIGLDFFNWYTPITLPNRLIMAKEIATRKHEKITAQRCEVLAWVEQTEAQLTAEMRATK